MSKGNYNCTLLHATRGIVSGTRFIYSYICVSQVIGVKLTGELKGWTSPKGNITAYEYTYCIVTT